MNEKKPRDITAKQFSQALERNGIKPVGFLGYYDIGTGKEVSVLNACTTNRRARLAYLLSMQAREVVPCT